MAKIYRYPYDMMDRSTDYMLIESIEYKPSGKLPDFTSTNSTFQRLKTAKAKYNIVLPMPNQIAQANTVGWGESRISALAGTGVNALANGLQMAAGENGLVVSASAGLDAKGNKRWFVQETGVLMENTYNTDNQITGSQEVT